MYLYRRARLVSKLLKLNEADGDWRITLMNIFYVRSMLFAGHLSRIIIIMKCFPNVFLIPQMLLSHNKKWQNFRQMCRI